VRCSLIANELETEIELRNLGRSVVSRLSLARSAALIDGSAQQAFDDFMSESSQRQHAIGRQLRLLGAML